MLSENIYNSPLSNNTNPLNINLIYNNTKSLYNMFDFINCPEKMKILNSLNDVLNISKSKNNNLIFIYSAPKVGSTSIVSSLRIFCSDKFDIIHIHDEEMLRVLTNIDGITINEVILYNKFLGKNIYVIDVFRSPIERKISTFFEKIGSYHFNDSDVNVNKYNVNKIINRFNNIFPYIGLGDHFIDKYNINIPERFDFEKKYLLVESNGVKYIKLRLKDSHIWNSILSSIFEINICIVKDYQSNNKPIKDIYNNFNNYYKIPENLLDIIMKCKYLNYYYSPYELDIYYNEWKNKMTNSVNYYTQEQFNLYEEITIENSHIDYIQIDHYMDEGCRCKACALKRKEFSIKLLNGVNTNERIFHNEAKNELIQKRADKINRINRINNLINNIPKKIKKKGINIVMNKL
jgi:hypothetical protein